MEQRETAKSIISKAIAHTSNYSELITWDFIVNVLSESAKYSHHILGWEGDIVNRKIELTSGTESSKNNEPSNNNIPTVRDICKTLHSIECLEYDGYLTGNEALRSEFKKSLLFEALQILDGKN